MAEKYPDKCWDCGALFRIKRACEHFIYYDCPKCPAGALFDRSTEETI